jgi:hypothetical protein
VGFEGPFQSRSPAISFYFRCINPRPRRSAPYRGDREAFAKAERLRLPTWDSLFLGRWTLIGDKGGASRIYLLCLRCKRGAQNASAAKSESAQAALCRHEDNIQAYSGGECCFCCSRAISHLRSSFWSNRARLTRSAGSSTSYSRIALNSTQFVCSRTSVTNSAKLTAERFSKTRK